MAELHPPIHQHMQEKEAQTLRTEAKSLICRLMSRLALAGEDGYSVQWQTSQRGNPGVSRMWVGLMQPNGEPMGSAGTLVCVGTEEGPDLQGPILSYTYMEWWAFVEGAKDGEFNPPPQRPSPLEQIRALVDTGEVPSLPGDPLRQPAVRIPAGAPGAA